MDTLSGAPLRVAELFAGVGGFRMGLEGWGGGAVQPCSGQYKVVFSNQWEPSKRVQHASDVYVARWGAEGHYNEDICGILSDPGKFASLAAARPDVLVGGFPCQDYSVASTAAQGITGTKGKLWWAVHAALRQLADAGQPVRHVVLENVDRLLTSPTKRRGADFATILASVAGLGYTVEWRVINAADYGCAQRRKRIFIVAHHRDTPVAEETLAACRAGNATAWLVRHGVLADAFPAGEPGGAATTVHLGCDVVHAQAEFGSDVWRASPFRNAGVMVGGGAWTVDLKAARQVALARYTGVDEPLTLGHVVAATGPVSDSFYLQEDALARWEYLKGAKRVPRTKADGHRRVYAEGAVTFPDDLAKPSRTVITGEGGTAPSRFKHVVRDASGSLRRLTPEELENLNGFPRGFTRIQGVSDVQRAFLMGNALVVGLVAAIGRSLAARARAGTQAREAA